MNEFFCLVEARKAQRSLRYAQAEARVEVLALAARLKRAAE